MSQARSTLRSPFMEWAKLDSRARFNLASSGISNYLLAELPARLEDLELSGPDAYGYAPLIERLAAYCGVPAACVVHACGTSFANHLAMAAAIEPGDEVLIEQPAYELLITTSRFLGAEVRRFPRRFEQGFRIDPAAVEQNLTPRTRLIVLTNLHNPSGALTEESTLQQVGALARRVGARVLVDEVYLEMAFENRPRSALHLGEQFLVTSSLTKAYGLSGLRCGWVLAAPPLAERMWRLNDLFGVLAAHPAEKLSVLALEHRERIAARARRLLSANRPLLDQFLDARSDLRACRPKFGTMVFPQLAGASVEQLCALLRAKYETSVAPGSFFEMPEHFRVGIGGETQMVAAGLERLAAALDELAR